MHLDPSDPDYLLTENGYTYMGVSRISVFHGQGIRDSSTAPTLDGGGDWRVDGRDLSFNARGGWECPIDEGYWYMGTIEDMEGESTLTELLYTWGLGLWTEGYVSSLGLRLVIEPPNGPPTEEIDPRDPGFVVYPPDGYTT